MAQDAAERTEWIEWDAVAGDGADGLPSDRTDDQ